MKNTSILTQHYLRQICELVCEPQTERIANYAIRRGDLPIPTDHDRWDIQYHSDSLTQLGRHYVAQKKYFWDFTWPKARAKIEAVLARLEDEAPEETEISGDPDEEEEPISENGAPKTNKLWKYSVLENSWKQVVLARSAGFDFLRKSGYDPEEVLIVVDANLSDATDENVFDSAVFRLHALLKQGFGPQIAAEPEVLQSNLKKFVPGFAGSGQIRNSGFFMVAGPDLRNKIWDEAYCGFSPLGEKFATNKAMAYAALLFSSSRPLKEVYGFDFDIEKVVIVPDATTSKTVRADVLKDDGSNVDLNVERQLTLAFNDGQALYEASLFEKRICKSIRKLLRNIAPAFSFRASVGAFKGLMCPFYIRAWCKARGIQQITDIWGVAHAVDDIQVVASASTFKQKGLIRDGDGWEDFCREFEARGGHFRVCVEEHQPRPARMSYQFLQTLVAANDGDIQRLAERSAGTLRGYRDWRKAAQLLGGTAGKIARVYPQLMKLRWSQQTLRSAYTSRRHRALGGSVLATGANAFAACDPVAFMEAACGLLVRGCLKDGECIIFPAESGKVDICRSPQLDHSHVVLRNVKAVASRFLVPGPTVYFNVHDETVIRLRMDYDGDHVWYCTDVGIIDLVERTNVLLGVRVTDWNAPEGTKGIFSFGLMAEFLSCNTQGNQIGTYADNATRVWAARNEIVAKYGEETFRAGVAWLTWAGNVLIDAAKHGSVNVTMPEFVQACVYGTFVLLKKNHYNRVVWRKPFPDLDALKAYQEKNAIQKGCSWDIQPKHRALPFFAMYAKADKENPVGSEYWDVRIALTTGVGDRYFMAATAMTDAEFVVDGIAHMPYSYEDLMFVPNRKQGPAAGLCRNGKKNADGEYADQGIFNRYAFMRASEMKNAQIDQGKVSGWLMDKDSLLMLEVESFCYDRRISMEFAYDNIVRNVLKMSNDTQSDGKNNVLYRTLFSAFGDYILRALEYNGFSANETEFDFLWEDDEEYFAKEIAVEYDYEEGDVQ